jgi:hypothetical protein
VTIDIFKSIPQGRAACIENADQRGLGHSPTSILQRKKCFCIDKNIACRIDSPVKNLGALLKKDFTEKRLGSGDWPQIGLIFAGFWCTACIKYAMQEPPLFNVE